MLDPHTHSWAHTLTSEVGAVGELHLLADFGDDAGHTVLDEVHLLPHGPLTDDIVVGLEDFKLQLTQHPCHKVGVRIGKQGHGGHQLTAVEINDFLRAKTQDNVSTLMFYVVNLQYFQVKALWLLKSRL